MLTLMLAWVSAAYAHEFRDLFFLTFILDWVLIVVAGNVFSKRKK